MFKADDKGIIHENNYLLMAVIAIMVIWPAVFVYLIFYDMYKGNKFRPFYMAVWPFMILFELMW